MATRLYSISVGEKEEEVTEAVGSATTSNEIEVTVDIANTIVNAGGSTRSVEKHEVIEALEKIKNHILKGQWPPA